MNLKNSSTIILTSCHFIGIKNHRGCAMKSNQEPTDLINTKVLDILGAKKEQIGKTMFKLSPQWNNFLRKLAKSSKLTLRDFLDTLASIAEQAHRENTLPDFPPIQDGIRMSFSISNKAKEIFTHISHERRISRDCLIHSTLLYIANEIKKNNLTNEEKIHYAKILIDARDKMISILTSNEVSQAIEKLSSSGDQTFEKYNEILTHIDQLHELDLEEYIEQKQHTAK